jgi:hypothetical protein
VLPSNALIIRRVITGETPAGEAVFSLVEDVAPQTNDLGEIFHMIWGADGELRLPVDGMPRFAPTAFPPLEGGFRVSTVELPPGYTGRNSPRARDTLRRPVSDPETGMHKTDSVDVAVVISGEVVLDQGAAGEVTLRRGDVLVQNGALHAWRNRSDESCVLVFVVLAAERG